MRIGRQIFKVALCAILFIVPCSILLVAYDAVRGNGFVGVVRIEKGSNLNAVVHTLSATGITKKHYDTLYKIILRALKLDKALKAGEYQVIKTDTPIAVFKKIIGGDYFYRKVVIPEGLTNYQVVKILASAEAMEGEIPDTYRPSLMPDTYNYKYGDTIMFLLETMAKSMREFVDAAWPERDEAVKLSKEDVITLSSIVEKEAATDEERGIIAAVYLNRIANNMRLQADPTVVYAISNGRGYIDRPLTHEDMSYASPFNTYMVYGLPPDPICNPSKQSIMGVLRPAKVGYLYFVKDPSGPFHRFSYTYKEHLINVRALQNARNSSKEEAAVH